MNETLLERILTVGRGTPRVAILMSGIGSNADNILKHREMYPNFTFVAIATDNPKSNARKIATRYGLECIEKDYDAFSSRDAFFHELLKDLQDLKVDFLLYAGFLRISPGFFVRGIPGINVHPSDLSIRDERGMAKYIGMKSIEKAVFGGEEYIASTACVVDEDLDQGVPLVVSKHLVLARNPFKSIKDLHEILKKGYEHNLYPLTLQLLATNALKANALPIQLESEEKI